MQSNDLKNKWRDGLASVPGAAAAVVSSAKWRRRAAWAVGAVLVLWGVAYVAVPPLVKSQIEKIASDKLGRKVTVGAVDFKPWSLELTVNDLAIAKASSASPPPGTPAVPQLAIKRLYIDAELQSLLRLAPVVDAIQIDEPAVSLTHLGAGRYDIDDVLARLKAASQDKAAEPAADPPRFALYNLALKGGQLDFTDLPLQKSHALRELTLSVPFLSNLQSKREIKTAPHLAFRLNGSRFDTAAEGTPFAQTRKTDARITLRDFDLGPYLAYWPASLPVKLQSAVLQADAKVAFEQNPDTLVRVSGSVTASQVRLLDTLPDAAPANAASPGSHELLAFEQLKIDLDDVRPLAQFVKLSSIALTAPTLTITRNRAGQLNLLPPSQGVATKNIAASAREMGATGQKDSQALAQAAAGPARPASASVAAPSPSPSLSPWTVQIASVALRAGRIHWLDQTLASPAQVRLVDVSLDASAIAMPFAAAAPLQFKGSLALDPASERLTALTPVKAGRRALARAGLAPPAGATAPSTSAAAPAAALALIQFSGSASDQAAQLTATVTAWPLTMATKYVGQLLLPALGGQLDAQLGVNWQAARGDTPPALQITAPQLALTDVQLAQGKIALVSVKRVDFSAVDIDVPGQTLKAAKLQFSQPRALVERDADKRWMYERWTVNSGAPAEAPAAAPAKPAAPSWAVAINEVLLEGGVVSFSDKGGVRPVAFEVSALQVQLGGLVVGERLAGKPGSGKAGAPAASQAMPLSVSLRLKPGASGPRFEAGKLDFKGSLGLRPVQTQGRLAIDRLPVQAFEPYFADALNIELLRADASFKGRVAYRQNPAGPQVQVAGDVSVEEFKANTSSALAPSEELLSWKALSLRGLDVALDPAKATRVDVKETVLSDFFARVIVLPSGRINLQDLAKPVASAAPVAAAPDAGATKTGAASARADSATGPKDVKKSAETEAGGTAPPALISFGPMSFINGKVLFSDRFVKPNYSANLSELTGKLSAFSSASPADGSAPNMADLELRGRAEGTASLEILGQLNPLAKPLALDIKGKVRDLELPPLSPYAIKYSGYGINRGKLSVDVGYLIKPDGQLTATNKVILNQLSFGDKVEGATASLPVKLAVALLADRNGVIDIDLPISGSLNDPQFSLGPIIIKVIINVIVKAITAPFSLLAGALGGGAGGADLSSVSFAPGSAALAPDARTGLDKVAKALMDRPALKLTVVGTSSLEAEQAGYKRERLDGMVRAEKRRQMVKEGGTTAAEVSVSPADYPALLKEVYKRADMPKPRNLVGLAKDLPEADMENLLLASMAVDEEAMRALAVQRGVAVRDYLATQSLPLERLFLGAAKSDKTVPPDAKWTPRAELILATP